MLLNDTCDQLKQHVEEEVLAASMDEGVSVETPDLFLFVLVQDQRMIKRHIIAVVIPTKRLPLFCYADVVINEKANLQQAYAYHENWIVAFFLSSFFTCCVFAFFSLIHAEHKKCSLTRNFSSPFLPYFAACVSQLLVPTTTRPQPLSILCNRRVTFFLAIQDQKRQSSNKNKSLNSNEFQIFSNKD